MSGKPDRRALFICGHCSEGIIIAFLPGIGGNLSQIRDLTSHNFIVLEVWPPLSSVDAPPDTPDRAALYYKQALENLKTGHFDASGMMFRKCLESALKSLSANASGSLVKRIDNLAEKGAVTGDLRDWAHQIRLGGNEAAHDDEPFSQRDVERLQAFGEAFLRYVFTLPALVHKGMHTATTEVG